MKVLSSRWIAASWFALHKILLLTSAPALADRNFYINYHYNEGVGGLYDMDFTPTNDYEYPEEAEGLKKWEYDRNSKRRLHVWIGSTKGHCQEGTRR